MIPPEHVTIYEGELASFWFDENGILCANSKSVPRTLEKQKANYDLVRQITGNRLVCLLADNIGYLYAGRYHPGIHRTGNTQTV